MRICEVCAVAFLGLLCRVPAMMTFLLYGTRCALNIWGKLWRWAGSHTGVVGKERNMRQMDTFIY